MRHFLFFLMLLTFGFFKLNAQNISPVAVSDSITVIAEDTAAIQVLLNDYDPDGNTIYVDNAKGAHHGIEWDDNDSLVFYRSNSFFGQDSLKYRIKDDGYPSKKSDYTYVYINVLENPNIPVAFNDSLNALSQNSSDYNILLNDYDLNSDKLKILNIIFGPAHGTLEILSDSVVRYKSDVYYTGMDHFRYNIIEKNTSTQYFSNKADVYINVEDNPHIPIAVDDEASAKTFIPININLLSNDYDPDNDNIKIYEVNGSSNCNVEIISDSIIKYTPYLYAGTDKISYRIIERNTADTLISQWAHITVHIETNEDIPVPNPDTGSAMLYDSVEINVLVNDIDAQQEPFAIYEVQALESIVFYKDEITISDSVVKCKLKYPMSGIHRFRYRIREVNDTTIYSNWCNILINVSPNPDSLYCVNDTASTLAGIPVELNIIENDYNPTGDTIIVFSGGGKMGLTEILTDSTIKYTPFFNAQGIDTLQYQISKKDSYLPLYIGFVFINITSNHSYEKVNVNNIAAGINSYGMLFADIDYTMGDGQHSINPSFEVPAGSGINSIFNSNLWIGGVDENSVLHFAGEKYKQMGDDFWFGPVSDIYDQSYDRKWIQEWKLNKSDIVYHINHYDDEGYVPIDNILKWPGNGDVENGQAEQLAPYFDKNNNGIYEPLLGDYPLIRGDQAVFFIFNDDRLPHTESQGRGLGVEIHGMAYAFNAPQDSALWNTIFVHYDIYNRSETTYDNTYIGEFIDTDLGNCTNDYILCDVKNGSMITYNGTDNDPDYIYDNDTTFGYGTDLPALAITVLGGPYMEKDNLDNPTGGCDESINGMNFGNGIVDDERLGLQYFMYFYSSSGHSGDPTIAPEYYNYLHGKWKDGTHLVYGGGGYGSDTIGLGPDCNFIFPGNSDTCNWGTGGVSPVGGYGNDGFYWTEETGNNGSPNPPGDRRGLISTGPFNFKPGDKQEMDVSYTFAMSYNRSNPVDLVKGRVAIIRTKVKEDSLLELPKRLLSVKEVNKQAKIINVFPNPSGNGLFNIDCRNIKGNIIYGIFSISGRKIDQGKLMPRCINPISLPSTKKGIYILQLQTPKGNYYAKLLMQ